MTGRSPGTTAIAQANPNRLLSLDVVRGITIAFMIMVNNNGSEHAWPFMKHAAWNGMTATDLVFPTFLFVVGVSVVFAFEARLAKGATRGELAWQTVRRAAVLFFLGLMVNGFGEAIARFPNVPFSTWRIYGVLQRIAICYLIAALLYLWDRKASTKVAVVVVALVGYWIVMQWVPVPGLGVPGRDIPFLDRDANMVAWLDRQLLPGRLYEGVRDPEGLLSDLPALGTALLGVLTGIWLRSKRTLKIKGAGLDTGAFALIALGSIWSIWFPLNKKLWTSSYVLVAAGISLGVLALCFWAIEVKGWRGKWTWAPLVLGSNAIAAYMVSELLPAFFVRWQLEANGRPSDLFHWIFVNCFSWVPEPGLASFAYSFCYMALCFLPVWLLYRKKIFIKV